MQKDKSKILIDTDPGIGTPGSDVDDGIAILLALASPEIEVVGLTTVSGNVHCDSGTKNTLDLLEQIGRTEIPVAQGCSKPLGRRSELLIKRERAEQFSPLPEKYLTLLQPLHGVDLLIEKIKQAKDQLTIAAIGPLTNLALALVKEPSISGQIKEIVLMGGAAGSGNITPVAEFNLLNDPEAADLVFRSGVPLTMIGLEITTSVRIYEPDIRPWRDAKSTVVKSLYDNTVSWMNYRQQVRGEKDAGCFFHDAMVIAYLADHSLFKTIACHVDIELDGTFTRGMTVVDRRPTSDQPVNVNLITNINAKRFVELTVKRIVEKFD